MLDCWPDCEPSAVAHVTIRWCEDHHHWIVNAWARKDGDASFREVHPMWGHPRVLSDDGSVPGTLQLLLTAAQREVQLLERESRSGQLPLW